MVRRLFRRGSFERIAKSKRRKGKVSMMSQLKLRTWSATFLLLMSGMVVALGTVESLAAEGDDLEATRREVRELRQMVQKLSAEVHRLKNARGKREDIHVQYQEQLEALRNDVSKLNESPLHSLESRLGKLHFGGYGDIHANFSEGTESDKFDFHRLVLYLGYDFADWIQFHSETELEHAWTEDGYVLLEQAYLDFLFSDEFNVRAGRILTPLGIINAKHEPTLFNGVERPNVAKYIIPSTWSSDGVGIFGSPLDGVNYELYVVAGLNGDEFSASGIRDGRMKGRQSLNEPALTGRIDFRPELPASDQSLRLGMSGYAGGLDNKDGGGGNGKDGEIAIGSADFEYSISKFDFRGVVAHTNIDGARDFGDGVAEEMFGWYVEGAYHFWPEDWKTGKLEKADAVVFARYEEYDTQYEMPAGVAKNDTKDRDEITFGINFYPVPNLVLKADYQIRNDAARDDLDDLLNLGIGFTF